VTPIPRAFGASVPNDPFSPNDPEPFSPSDPGSFGPPEPRLFNPDPGSFGLPPDRGPLSPAPPDFARQSPSVFDPRPRDQDPMDQTMPDPTPSSPRFAETAYFPSAASPPTEQRVAASPTPHTDDRERWGVPPPAHRRERQGNRWLIPMLIAVAVLAIGSIGVVAFALGSNDHKSPSKKPPPVALSQVPASPPAGNPSTSPQPSSPAPTSPAPSSPGGAAEASSVNSVLQASAATRQQVVNTDLTTCDGLTAAIPTLQKVVSERQGELQKAQSTDVGQLPSGSDLHTALVGAMQNSLKADQAYLAWATSVKGCSGTPPANANSQTAQTMNGQAGQSKQQFLQLWAPIAQQDNLPAYKDGDI
jgi:hypothetical protein